MDLELNGKRVFVSGGGRGIGKTLVQAFAAEGAVVALCGRDPAALHETLESIGGEARGHRALSVDLTTDDGPRAALDWIDAKTGLPDVVVHNAGGTLGVSDPYAPINDWRRVFRLNFETIVELNNGLVPKMIERGSGRIISMSSLAAAEHRASIQYSIAKTMLSSYTKILARTVARHGVIVTSLVPGAVMTEGSPWDIKREQDPAVVENYMREVMPMGRFMTPEEVAAFVLFLSSTRSSAAAGSTFFADGAQRRGFEGGV